MSDDIIKIKGNRSGLQLTFSEGAGFEEIEGEILRRLESGSNFFVRGTEIFIPKGTLPDGQIERLRKMFHQHGMMFRTEERETAAHQNIGDPPKEQDYGTGSVGGDKDVQQMLVVKRTLRGGQEIRTESSVLIFGNVNPGAQVIAGGSIDIRGTCRGTVHAGAFGDSKAVIMADRLMPMQIRIANLIARSPDGQTEMPDHPEQALIRDGQITIESIER